MEIIEISGYHDFISTPSCVAVDMDAVYQELRNGAMAAKAARSLVGDNNVVTVFVEGMNIVSYFGFRTDEECWGPGEEFDGSEGRDELFFDDIPEKDDDAYNSWSNAGIEFSVPKGSGKLFWKQIFVDDDNPQYRFHFEGMMEL